jgi:DNA-directed RNA polymerase specialized sigma24 family protein
MYSREIGEVEVGYRRTLALDRTTAEDLIAQVRMEGGFSSSAYKTLSEHLWGYAMPVIKDSLRTGKMPKMLLERGIHQFISASDRVALHTSLEARDDLAIDIVTAGEAHLKAITIPKNRWKPDEGASIETFFITGCLFQFPSVYRKWSKERTDHHSVLVGLLPETFAPATSTSDTAETAVNREMAHAVLREADDTTRAILALLAADHTYAEVGEAIGLSERAVEGRVYRFRTAVRDTFHNEKPASGRRGRAA